MTSSSRRYLTPFDVIKLREQVVMDMTYHNLIGSCITRLYLQILTANATIDLSNRIQALLEEETKQSGNKSR